MGRKRAVVANPFDARIRLEIRRRGLTSKAAADLAAINPSIVSRLMAGTRSVSLDNAWRLCRALGIAPPGEGEAPGD